MDQMPPVLRRQLNRRLRTRNDTVVLLILLALPIVMTRILSKLNRRN